MEEAASPLRIKSFSPLPNQTLEIHLEGREADLEPLQASLNKRFGEQGPVKMNAAYLEGGKWDERQITLTYEGKGRDLSNDHAGMKAALMERGLKPEFTMELSFKSLAEMPSLMSALERALKKLGTGKIGRY